MQRVTSEAHTFYLQDDTFASALGIRGPRGVMAGASSGLASDSESDDEEEVQTLEIRYALLRSSGIPLLDKDSGVAVMVPSAEDNIL